MMLYTLVVVLCLQGGCEGFVWRDLMPAWECMAEAYELNLLETPADYSVQAALQAHVQD